MATTKAGMIAWFVNFSQKIVQYAAVLGLSNQEVQDAQALATEFVAVMNEIDNAQLSMKAANEWRQEVLFGPATDKPAAAPPVFAVLPTPTVTTGIMEQISKLRDVCMLKPGFNTSIGEDLGFIGQQVAPRPPSQITPSFRVTPGENFTVTLTGNMQGFGVARVQYRRNGGEFNDVGFIMNSGSTVNIPMPSDGKPEVGEVRTVFVRHGQNYGNFSDPSIVTIS